MIYYQNTQKFNKAGFNQRWRSDHRVKSAIFKKDCRSDGWYLRKLYSLLSSKNGPMSAAPLWPNYVKNDNINCFNRTKDDII